MAKPSRAWKSIEKTWLSRKYGPREYLQNSLWKLEDRWGLTGSVPGQMLRFDARKASHSH